MNIEKRYEIAKKKLPIYWNNLVHNDNIDVVWSEDGEDFLIFTNSENGDEIISYNTKSNDPKFKIEKYVITNFLKKLYKELYTEYQTTGYVKI